MKAVKNVLLGIVALVISILSVILILVAAPFAGVVVIVGAAFESLSARGKRLQEEGPVKFIKGVIWSNASEPDEKEEPEDRLPRAVSS